MPVVGRLDVVTTDGTVVDWKTTGRTPSVGDLASKAQTELYVKATGGAMRYVFLVDLKTKPKVVVAEIPEAEAAMAGRLAEATVADTSQGMATGVWPRNREGWHCSEKWCGYYHQCMSGRSDPALAELASEARKVAAAVEKGT